MLISWVSGLLVLIAHQLHAHDYIIGIKSLYICMGWGLISVS